MNNDQALTELLCNYVSNKIEALSQDERKMYKRFLKNKDRIPKELILDVLWFNYLQTEDGDEEDYDKFAVFVALHQKFKNETKSDVSILEIEDELNNIRAEFDRIHEALASQGKCDGTGGCEYGRVYREWLQSGHRKPIDRFIHWRSNLSSDGGDDLQEPFPAWATGLKK